MRSNHELRVPLCKLAHDLNNKLTIIIGSCDLLEDEVASGSECAKRLAIIQKTAQDMVREIRLRSCKPTEKETAKIICSVAEP